MLDPTADRPAPTLLKQAVRKIAALGLGTLLATAALTPAAHAAAPGLDRRELQRTLDEVPKGGLPGAYSAVQDGRQSWRGATGLADLEARRPMQPGMYHRVGSITKTFVATAVLQLVERGRLQLDAPVEQYLPGLLPDRRITVRMLLNHTSHIGDYDSALITSPDSLEEMRVAQYTKEELVKLGLGIGASGEPGESPGSYSNTNYIVLGLLLDKVSGMPAERYITRHVIQRADLEHTFFPRTSDLPRPHAKAYTSFFGSFPLRDFSTFSPSSLGTAGAMVSTMEDLNRFYRALFTGRLIGQAQLAEMRKTVPVALGPGSTETMNYGLGLIAYDSPCGRLWGHDGGVVGMGALSLSTEDGGKQASSGINMTWHLGAEAGEQAWIVHAVGAMCGTNRIAASDAPMPLIDAGAPPAKR
ncbi:serine hydrolase domain-containing protein [Microtetraspora malaysiensis]|uniref:serine hydrolase domain-containing protein n=1 Tax=Microtetraspora malaysiensis TaxID=161358 RepID=UPI000AE115BB|nr:serine hydrolase domain-containing protein [Microtetraspora malaysiensis]